MLEDEAGFTWSGWDEDEERPGVYIVTISDPQEEEYAVIVHRTCGDAFPLDGQVAQDKLRRAQAIVNALNAQEG